MLLLLRCLPDFCACFKTRAPVFLNMEFSSQPLFTRDSSANTPPMPPFIGAGPYMGATQPVPSTQEHEDYFAPSQNISSSWGAPKQYHVCARGGV